MKQDLGPLGAVDLLTARELNESLGHHFDLLMQRWYRADKFMRVPLVTGTASGGVLNIVSTVGPAQGYAWDIGLLGVGGLTAGTTPDLVNMQFGGGPGVTWWQFTGNAFVSKFSRGEMVMLPGETFTLLSQGSFAATGPIVLYGNIRTEAPADKISSIFA
jgi:hypothetical protein